MNTYRRLLPFLFLTFLVVNAYPQPNTQGTGVKWTGSITMVEKGVFEAGGERWTSERYVEANFTQAIPTMWRSGLGDRTDLSFSDDKGSGSVRYRAESRLGTTTCSATGQTQLHEVLIDLTRQTYTIAAIGPANCSGETIYNIPGVPPERHFEDSGNDMIVNDQPLGGRGPLTPNTTQLSGSVTIRGDTGVGIVTRTITWNLSSRPVDVELIVTPADYDTWLPRPGRNEMFKGSVMKISLKVQGRNGRPSTLSAVRFELKLSNTSQEPGTTLNSPLQPSRNQLPDLRFLVTSNAESIRPDQSQTINSLDGSTGEAYIGSYDGGGWSTLTAEAVLQGGTRIKGTLLRPGGPQDILIPKRDVGEHIAASWLAANGNPAERDDRERSPGNSNLGDGLTAYEEYRGFMGFKEDRGVFSGPEFIRLDPQKKELGIITKALFDFAEGIYWFKNASGIKPIIFSENDIGSDRRFNKNASNAHIYEQYAIKLENDDLPGDVVGQNDPNNVKPMYPERSQKVVVDKAEITAKYQQQSRRLPQGTRMPYTLDEDLANTVAHELAHSVNVVHHGPSSAVPPRKAHATSQAPYRIYWFDGSEETDRPYPVDANVFLESTGTVGNDSSGDLACIMAYTNLYNWAFMTAADGSLLYRKTKLLPMGKTFCTKDTGTGINACPNPRGRGFWECPMYFGDAAFGNCLSQFKLKP